MCMTVSFWMWVLQIILLLCSSMPPSPEKRRRSKTKNKEADENALDCVSLQVWALQTVLLLCFQDSDDISFEAYARIQHVLTGFWLHALAGIVQLVSSYIITWCVSLTSCLCYSCRLTQPNKYSAIFTSQESVSVGRPVEKSHSVPSPKIMKFIRAS